MFQRTVKRAGWRLIYEPGTLQSGGTGFFHLSAALKHHKLQPLWLLGRFVQERCHYWTKQSFCWRKISLRWCTWKSLTSGKPLFEHWHGVLMTSVCKSMRYNWKKTQLQSKHVFTDANNCPQRRGVPCTCNYGHFKSHFSPVKVMWPQHASKPQRVDIICVIIVAASRGRQKLNTANQSA